MPKRSLARIPSYRLHRPTGQAVVTLSGKDFYLGPHGTATSKAEYDRLVAEWAANGRRVPDESSPSDLVVNELVLAYLNHAQRYYVKEGKPTSEQCCIKQALRPLQQLYGLTCVADFGPMALKTVRQAMIEAGLCRNVVNRNTARVRRMFKWATENELAPASVFHGLMAVSGLRAGRSETRETTPIRPVPGEHVDAIRPHVSRQVWAMVQLQLLTGMRSGEVTIMRARDIDMTEIPWRYRPASHKTEHHGHERIVELGPRAREVIKPFLNADTMTYLFSPADAELERRASQRAARKTPLSCGNRPGTNRRRSPRWKPHNRYDKNSYYRAIMRACDRADAQAKDARQLPPDAERIVPALASRTSYATASQRGFGKSLVWR